VPLFGHQLQDEPWGSRSSGIRHRVTGRVVSNISNARRFFTSSRTTHPRRQCHLPEHLINLILTDTCETPLLQIPHVLPSSFSFPPPPQLHNMAIKLMFNIFCGHPIHAIPLIDLSLGLSQQCLKDFSWCRQLKYQFTYVHFITEINKSSTDNNVDPSVQNKT
jgi:hypothetical protein